MNIDSAYNSAIRFAKTHYENFPVISFLIPKRLRKHVAIIYWFARIADDIADEGNLSEEERLIQLNEFEKNFGNLIAGEYKSDYEMALHQTIKERELNPEHFINLLKAFKQDVLKKRYDSYDELLNYCSHSANPVGRLILELYGIRDEQANKYSDKICTALQITNFLQDVKIDYKKGRIYLPRDEMQSYKVSEIIFEESEINLNFKKLIVFNINRTQKLFDDGRNLLKFLSGRLKLEIKWTIYGGELILKKIRDNDNNVFVRPSLTKADVLKLLFKVII
jgi:squalene synthase HpnC